MAVKICADISHQRRVSGGDLIVNDEQHPVPFLLLQARHRLQKNGVPLPEQPFGEMDREVEINRNRPCDWLCGLLKSDGIAPMIAEQNNGKGAASAFDARTAITLHNI